MREGSDWEKAEHNWKGLTWDSYRLQYSVPQFTRYRYRYRRLSGGQDSDTQDATFRGCFALLRGRFARFAQGITHISQTFRNVSRTFRGRFTIHGRTQGYTGEAMFRNVSARGRAPAGALEPLRGITPRGFHEGRNACFAHVTRTLRGHNAS